MGERIKVTALRTMSPMPARIPAQERKPFPIRRHKVDPTEDTVQRRNAPGEASERFAAEVRRQLHERQISKAQLASELGWTAARVNKLLRPDGPTQALTLDDAVAIAKAMGASLTSLLIGAEIVPDAAPDLVDAVYSDRIGTASKQMIVRAIQLARSVDQETGSDLESR